MLVCISNPFFCSRSFGSDSTAAASSCVASSPPPAPPPRALLTPKPAEAASALIPAAEVLLLMSSSWKYERANRCSAFGHPNKKGTALLWMFSAKIGRYRKHNSCKHYRKTMKSKQHQGSLNGWSGTPHRTF